MSQIELEKKITYFIVLTLIVQPILSILVMLVYPPDFSKEFPVYDPTSIMLMEIGGAFLIAGLTVMGIKLADEKKVLPAAGLRCLRSQTVS